MQQEWANWSGSLRFTPGSIVRPESEEMLVDLVRRANTEKRTVRVVGAGHSSSPLVETEDGLVSLERFQGIESYDSIAHEVILRAGMTLHVAGQALLKIGLALENLGDVDVQTLAGACRLYTRLSKFIPTSLGRISLLASTMLAATRPRRGAPVRHRLAPPLRPVECRTGPRGDR